jgi:putative thioredoxin
MSATTHVVDVTDADFEQVVIDGSSERPVVVDMWASWCAPCRTLGPILEKVAAERDGGFLLAKLDVDANAVGNALLQAVQSQGIPTVVAFRDGQPVSMFIGAYPEQEVNRFIDELLPTEAEVEADEALAEEAAGDLESAEAGYREALAKDPDNRDAAVGLARIMVGRGETEQAAALVEPFLPDPEAERVMATVRVHGWAALGDSEPLAEARRSAAAGRWREALDGLLERFGDDPTIARESMVDIFATLGEDPLVAEYRPKLAARLF